ncbi:tetratricopeptide repeat protein [Microcystis aeruginosa NIES-3806]|nr:tetratricopeptide repeat protein [Microcystis aeruginosa NIES-3806]
MRFDNVPFGRTQFAPTLWTKSVTVGAQSLRPPINWDIIRTQVPYLAIVHKVSSRGLLYAKLKQTEKAKIDLEQAAIIFYQQNNMATYEKVMQLLRKLGQ